MNLHKGVRSSTIAYDARLRIFESYIYATFWIPLLWQKQCWTKGEAKLIKAAVKCFFLYKIGEDAKSNVVAKS